MLVHTGFFHTLMALWTCGTFSDELMVLVPDSIAYQAWTRMKSIFHNSASVFDQEFGNQSLCLMLTLDAYRQRLKELANQLNGVDSLVTENRFVLQLVHGLPTEYHILASYITQSLPNGTRRVE